MQVFMQIVRKKVNIWMKCIYGGLKEIKIYFYI